MSELTQNYVRGVETILIHIPKKQYTQKNKKDIYNFQNFKSMEGARVRSQSLNDLQC